MESLNIILDNLQNMDLNILIRSMESESVDLFLFPHCIAEVWSPNNYPPYDIRKVGENKYNIEAALAGFNKKDIEVVTRDNALTIKTKKTKTTDSENGKDEVLHKGISKRYFERTFTIAEDIKVLGAQLKDGLLTVSLKRIVPEETKEKVIEIN